MPSYVDLLGIPYEKGAVSPVCNGSSKLDCLGVVCEMLDRFGKTHAARNLRDMEEPSAIYLGTGVNQLQRDGDVYYYQASNGEQAVAIRVEANTVLTSVPGHHVRAFPFAKLPRDGQAYRFIE